MKQYSRVTYGQRCQILSFLQTKMPIAEIASRLGFHKSSIYRELRRNSFKKTFESPIVYEPVRAQRLAIDRYKRCRKKLKISGQLCLYVENGLKKFWSPEQIAGRLKYENVAHVTHQSIYRFIQGTVREGYLRHGGRKQRRRRIHFKMLKRPQWMKNISERPEACAKRQRIGDWERDTMFAKERKALLVCTDRKSRYTKIGRIGSCKTEEVAFITKELLTLTGKKVFSITNDNGVEFMSSKRPLNSEVYHCDPFRPQQRGQ